MKYLKMLGLAAVAAMAVMAFVGAGTASASTLCTKTEDPCSAANTIKNVEASLIGGTARLETTGGTVLDTCSGGVVLSEQTKDGANPSSGPVTAINWSGCTNPTVTIATGELELDTISGTHNGTVTSRSSQVTVAGIFNSSCTYGTGTGTDLGTFVGGTDPTLVISAIVKKQAGGALCPGETRWTAEYTMTNHTEAYLMTA